MPKPFPKEFPADVIAVALQGNSSIAQVARSGRVAAGRPWEPHRIHRCGSIDECLANGRALN